MFSHADYMDLENTVIRSKKIRIYPQNKNKLNKFFGLSRYWYNQTLDVIKVFGAYPSLPTIRKIVQDRRVQPEWAYECPQRIREHAIADACKATQNAISKYKITKKYQSTSFRRKHGKQTLGFDAQSLKENYLFSSKQHRLCFKPTEEINATLEGTRLTLENNRYFLIVPGLKPLKQPENQRLNIVALDPGVRSFITYYSPLLHGKYGHNDFKKIFRLCLGLDKLISRISKAKCKQKRRLKKAQNRLQWKIKNLITELHHKTAKFLCDNFDIILIPTFRTQKMAQKLYSKVARNMLTFAHFRFKQHLKYKAEELGCKVYEVNEAYTSKTCSYCGKLQDIKSKNIFNCSCGTEVDRDYNGARNILLRALRVPSPPMAGIC